MNNPVIYDKNDALYVANKPEDLQRFGATGIRYVDDQTGGLVGCDETYTAVTPFAQQYHLHDIWEWTRCGQIFVGQGQANVIISLDGSHYVLHETPKPHEVRMKKQGSRIAVAVSDLQTAETVFYWFNETDITELPRETLIPTFTFNHPVMIAPFKDPDGTSGATHEIVVNRTGQSVNRPHFAAADSLYGQRGELCGIYSEKVDPISDLQLASMLQTRLMVCHDSITPWTLPKGLRAWDIPTLEFYLDPSESFEQSLTRWRRSLADLITTWAGDIGVIPMFYCQGGAPPNEVWTVDEVLKAIAPLSDLVNMSPRIKVIAPFSYQRANGIVAHPELQHAWANLREAGRLARVARLLPIAPKPPVPTTPYPPAKAFKGHANMKQYLTLKGLFLGVSPNPATLKSGDDAFPVYSDRATGGAWEECEVVQNGSSFNVRFVAANRALSMTPEGLLQSRPAGTAGPWESFQAMTQPDGTNLLYRREKDVVQPVLTIVEKT